MEVKAKVLLVSEEQMEVEDKYDLGNIAKSKQWVWRRIGLPVEEIYRITEYTQSKTVIQMYDGEKILILEPFPEVFTKWKELLVSAGNVGNEQEESEEGEREEEDKDDE